MERTFLRLSPENFITVALMAGVAYLGVIGAQLAIAKIKAKAAG